MDVSLWSGLVEEARQRGVRSARVEGGPDGLAVVWPDGARTALASEAWSALIEDVAARVFAEAEAARAWRDGLVAWIGAQGHAGAEALTTEPLPMRAIRVTPGEVEVHAQVVPGGLALQFATWDGVPRLDALAPDGALTALAGAPYGLVLVLGAPDARATVVAGFVRVLAASGQVWHLMAPDAPPWPGVNNAAVADGGLPAAVRSALRWDPDALVASAQAETAWTWLVQAALTGHLVVVGVESLDPSEALRGVDAYLARESVRGAVRVDERGAVVEVWSTDRIRALFEGEPGAPP